MYRYVCIRPQFTGKMVVSDSRETIDIIIQTDAAQSAHSGSSSSKSTRSLSGGERSFATACFILALWDVMDSPFRFLDEFDVFMDLVNRRMCMDLMLKAAEKKRRCQFVFLSPNNMSALSVANNPKIDLKVFEMAPPRDGKQDSHQSQPNN